MTEASGAPAPTSPSAPNPAPAAADPSTPSKAIHCLVIDTGPLIKNDPPVSTLIAQAEELFTIPSVISEVRDQATRTRLETTLLPFLTLRTPRPESIKFVSDFARKTGDLEVLSKPDIHIIALTYELECERNGGDWRLKKTPTQKGVNGAPPGRAEAKAEEDAEKVTAEQAAVGESSQTSETADTAIEEPSVAPPSDAEIPLVVSEKLEDLNLQAHPETAAEVEETPKEDVVEEAQDAQDDSSDEDSDGWVTPSNFKRHQQQSGVTAPTQPLQKVLKAAMLTSDFAMQNVALRINLNCCSPTFSRITQVKTWVLRCHGCYKVTRQMDKQFCPSCGQPTLTRVSCSTDAHGNFKLHLKRNFQWSHRGNVYSVPKPTHGTANGKNSNVKGGGQNGWGRDLILAEDQKEYINKVNEDRRTRYRDLMDEDYLPSILTGERRNAGGKIKVGAGKNVNARKKR